MKVTLEYMFLLLLILEISCSPNNSVQIGYNSVSNNEIQNRPNSNLIDNQSVDKPARQQISISKNTTQTWQIEKKHLGNDNLLDVFFVDSNHGWITSIKGNNLVPKGSNIYKTSNGGNSWQKIHLKIPESSFISNIFFVDKLKGWVVIQTESNSYKNIVSEINILETKDGGESWRNQQSLKNSYSSKIIFDITGEGWLVGSKATASYSYDRKILALHTSDFGSSWHDVSDNIFDIEKNVEKTFSMTGDSLVDIFSLSNSQAIVTSKTGKILQTKDAGVNWNLAKKAINKENVDDYKKTFFLNNSEILMMSASNLPEGTLTTFTLINGTELKDSYLLGGKYISDAYLLPENQLFACGLDVNMISSENGISKGTIIYTEDYKKWETIYTTSANCRLGCRFNKISFDKQDKFYFVGSDGILVIIKKLG
jgi:photosystem II stability/assembly factor-like uncharacterized protein